MKYKTINSEKFNTPYSDAVEINDMVEFSGMLGNDENGLVDGGIKFYESKGSMGTTIRRGFCDICGSGIVSYAKELPMIKFIKAGTLDDSSWLKVESSFFAKSSADWNAPDENIKSFEGNPNMLSNIKNVFKSL